MIVVLALTGVLTADRLANIVVGVTLVAAIAYFVDHPAQPAGHHRPSATRVIAFIPLFIASVDVLVALPAAVHRGHRSTPTSSSNRNLFGWEMPVSWVQSINPIFVIILSGVFAAIWTKLGDRQPSTPVKFAAGTVIMGIAFLLFLPMASTEPNSAPLLGLIGILFVFTIAELLLSPVGLSVSTKLAPKAFHTQMVALFFLSIALGTAMAGVLAGYYSDQTQVTYFSILGGIAIVVGVVLFLLKKPIERLMEGVR